MKKIKIILATAFISAAMLTGCRKDDNTTNDLAPANAVISGQKGNIDYQLQLLLPPAGGGIKWNSGTITVNQLVFQGTHVFGDMLERYVYTTNENKTWDMFSDPDMGFVPVVSNFYRSVSFQVSMGAEAAARETASAGDPLSALSLNGTFRDIVSGAYINKPVVFIVSQPVVLQTNWINSVTINPTSYLAKLSLDMTGVTNGISNSMLASAVVTSGTIYITATSNTDLYNIMVADINAAVMNVELSAQQSGTLSTTN